MLLSYGHDVQKATYINTKISIRHSATHTFSVHTFSVRNMFVSTQFLTHFKGFSLSLS